MKCNSALIVVDMQNDFMEGGTLAVPNSEEIIPPVNKLIQNFNFVVATKDWHPPDHYSFARNCGVTPFETVDGEMKWPDHCIAGTWGSEIHKNILTRNIRSVFHKGLRRYVESYSGFKDANGDNSGLTAYLKSPHHHIENVFICGLALDYCVKATAVHAAENFKAYIISDATRAVNPNFVFEYLGVELVTVEQALNM